jgi:RHS repeat-associated protein
MTNLYISFNSERQPYKFGGKELDEMHGLNWYDQGARPFDAIIPRTPTIDPLAEKYYNTSPYVQWGNNPINRIDPDGRVDIDANTQQQYPRLTEYLKNLLQEWNNKGETFKTAFKETSGLNDEQITAMLTFGQGPKLEVKNLDTSTSKINGETYLSDDGHGGVNNQNNGKGKIALDNDVVGMMENAQTSMDKETGHVMVESTTFHELTHVGNATTSHTGDGQFEESGRAFETKVYGQDIGRSNVATYVSSIRPKLIPIPALPILVVPNPHVIYSPIKF